MEQVAQRSTVAEVDVTTLLSEAYDSLHQTSMPVWNRQRESLEQMDGLLGLAVTQGEVGSRPTRFDSYVLFRPSNDVLNPESGAVAILDLCGSSAGMKALLHALQSRYENLAINSEADHSPALPCLYEAGFTVTHERLHMVSSLSDKSDVEELRNAVIRPRVALKL